MDALRRELIADAESNNIKGNYVVIGGGEAGTEIVYQLGQLLAELTKRYSLKATDYRVVVIEGANRMVPKCYSKIAHKVRKRLARKGIAVLTGQKVAGIDKGKVILANGKSLDSSRVVLAAGRVANHFFADNKSAFLLNREGFVRVTELQEAEGYNNIYIIGNSKELEYDLNTSGRPYDAEYVVNVMESKHGVREIRRYEPPEFELRTQLGSGWAVYESGQRAYTGIVGWVRKRWLDRRHFSTLLPMRLWLAAWTLGSQHDEIY